MSRNFKLPKLYPIINTETLRDPLAFAERLFRARVGIVQLRAKNLQLGESLELARSLIRLRDASATSAEVSSLVIINDSPELAMQAGADGVHLGSEDCTVASAREILGGDAVIGFSTHSLDDIATVDPGQLSYLGFGPVFLSGTKSGHAAETGLELLAEAVSRSSLPIVAIGGINLENAPMVYQAGASSVALIGDLEEGPLLEQRLAGYMGVSRNARYSLQAMDGLPKH